MAKESWKEWISIRALTERIPLQFQLGISVSSLKLTCLDAYHDHLVIGTNAGLVYLAHLPSFNIIKLKCDNASSSIQCVAAVSSVDDMIAAGGQTGTISIFQIPPASSNDLTSSQDSNMFKKNFSPKSPKRFTLNVHSLPVTSLTWSKNGMKLFSGDLEGNVFLIEIDYERSECTGKLLLKVDCRVVQLSYSRQMLAVSYEERCLLYNFKDNSKTFVGKKSRTPPGLFGCTFAPAPDTPMEDIVYCAQSSQRIWSANKEGVVLFSYINKKLPDHSLIEFRDISKPPDQNSKFAFGYLYHYKGSTLVSISGNCLVIIDVNKQKVLGYCNNFLRVCDVAVAGDEVFVLDNDRNIICLSPFEPSFNQTNASHPLTSSMHLPLQENLNLSALSEIKSKLALPNNQFMDGIAKLSETVASKISEIATPSIIHGTKAQSNSNSNLYSQNTLLRDGNCKVEESAPQTRVPTPFLLGLTRNTSFQTLQPPKANEKDYESMMDANKSEADERTQPTVYVDRDRNYDVVVPQPRAKRKAKKKVDITNKDPKLDAGTKEFNEDSRCYEDFKDKIEENESLLAEVLDLSCLRMDHDHEARVENESLEKADLGRFPSYKEPKVPSSPYCSLSSPPCSLESKIYGHFLDQDLTYGPPSGSSVAPPSLDESLLHCPRGSVEDPKSIELVNSFEGFTSQDIKTMSLPKDLPWDWQKHPLPANPRGFLGHGNILYLSEFRNVYFSSQFLPDNETPPCWRKRRLVVNTEHLSSSGEHLLLHTRDGRLLSVHRNNLLSSDPLQCSFLTEDTDVQRAAADESVLWTLHEGGKVMARVTSEEGRKEVIISCLELRLKDLICQSGVVWGLTTNGRIAYRIGVRPNAPVGLDWGVMLHPRAVRSIHLSENGLGWMLDSDGGFYVALYVSQSYPQGLDGKWWQIGKSDDMLELPSLENGVLITSNEHFLWLARYDSPFAFAHSFKSFIGHRWDRVGTGDGFSSISGEGIFKSFGVLYLTNKDGRIFVLTPESPKLLSLELPSREKAESVSSRPECLWVLTRSGKILIRTGLNGSSALGEKWVRLDMPQIADVRLKHLSLSAEVVWAVDAAGRVYMRQGPLSPPEARRKGLDPAWLKIDSDELKEGAVFEKVFVGSKSHLVWGIDSSHRVYVREAIFPEISTGTSWVFVPGILAQSISISEDRVFVITPSGGSCSDHSSNSSGGMLFEREGVTPTNYIGDSWKPIPTHSLLFTDLTASVDSCLWALDGAGRIWRHESLALNDVRLDDGTLLQSGEGGGLASSDLPDWEFIV